MKQIIITALALLAAGTSMAGGRHTIVTGSGVNAEGLTIAVGEPITGTLGDQTDWHVTSGQIQGISNLGLVTSSENPALISRGYSVYPNPVVDVLTITRPDASAATLTVTALNGTNLLTAPLSDATTIVDLSDLPSGIYVLLITPADGSSAHTAKIMKQ